MDLDFNDLTSMAETLKKVQEQTLSTTHAGQDVAAAQIEATKELAQAIRMLAGSILKVAEQCPIPSQAQES